MTRPGTQSSGATVCEAAPSGIGRSTSEGFVAFAGRVKAEVEGRLAPWLDERLAEAGRRGPDVLFVADAVRQLTLRGGKRLRPVLLAAAYESFGGEGGSESVVPAGVALELLQTYLLTHDDWMDRDEVRRGGPSVPAMMRARFGETGMAAMSVLAGDLAAAWARRALLETDLPLARVILAARELAQVEEDVVQGQVIDVSGTVRNPSDVEAMHALKTASYSVRGPLTMGAQLAGASPREVAGIAAFAEPLGVAFQLRDDVLDLFGDGRLMGKPAGSDLRKGKYSAVLVAQGESEALARAFGQATASDDDVRKAIASLETVGARTRVEGRIDTLARDALAALARATLTANGHALLAAAVVALTQRHT
jgi:geranylgeranyl diphosphate synthase, type I